MPQILLATCNPAKAARLAWLLDELPYDRMSLDMLVAPGAWADVEESGADFAANAVLKAVTWSKRSGGILTLASDGGIHIPSLGAAWNALHTRRNAGGTASDHDRIAHLLALMRDLDGEDRHAFWHEAVAVARHGALLASWQDRGDGGYIASSYAPSRLDNAFWTESIRFYPGAGKLYRDFDPEERGRHDTVWPALRALVCSFLRELRDPDG